MLSGDEARYRFPYLSPDIIQARFRGADGWLDPKRLTLFERSLVGSLGYRHDLPRVVALVASGTLDPSAIIGDIVPLSDAQEAMSEMGRGPGAAIKVLIDPRD